MTSLIKFMLHSKIKNYTECRRFAGHSKWANIKHTKMEKDSEKATVVNTLIRKMKIAIAEAKNVKPNENLKLGRLIAQAKKNSIPMATIKSFLEKMQKSKIGTQTAIFESRGPSGCVILIQLLSDNIVHTRQMINTHLRKTKFSPSEFLSQGTYEEKGIILTEVKNRNLEKAVDDAIEAGAEDAELCNENNKEFLLFTCHALELMKVQNHLDQLNYKVIQADVEYIPKLLVTLNDQEMELVSKLNDRLKNIDEVVKIYTNII